jgi:hypothetical protein
MTISPYLITEQNHQQAFEKYWKDRGVNVETQINTIMFGQNTFYTLSSNLKMKVPEARHDKIYGMKQAEIKSQRIRKWGTAL